MARIVRTLTFLLAVAFSAEVLGYHTGPFNTLLSLVFLAVFLWPYFPRDVLPRFRKYWPALLLIVATIVGVFCSVGWVAVLLISLLIGGIRISRLNEERDADLETYQTTAFAYGLFLWLWRETATGWYALDGMARGLMWVTHHFGLNATLGPTASGLPVIILFFTYGTACTIRMPEQRLRTMVPFFVSLLVVQIASVAVYDVVAAALSVSFVQQRLQGGAVPWYPFAFLQHLYPNNLQGVVFLLGLAVTLLLTPAPLQLQGKEKSTTPRRRTLIVGLGALLIGTALAGYVTPRPAAHGEVLICDAGYLDFRVPVYGAFGHKNGGMFGRLPGFLEGSGYRVRRGTVSPESLKSANVLVVINPMESFDAPTKKAIWDFVRKGGGLLVVGDHTCTHNIREPINDLLEPFNIELNFDSAKPFRDGWLEADSLPRHPTTMGIGDAINEIQIWIGASLTVRPPARPMIIGTYGFSDPGDMTNVKDGHLGNLQFDPGEKLGDLPLAAECRYGKGKALVFGDTSSLQNDALVSSHRFVENTFAWLTNSQKPAADLVRHYMAALLVLAGMILLASRTRLRSWPTIAAAVFLLGWALGSVPAKLLDAPSTAHNDIAWIDASHLERFSVNNMWIDEGIGGLTFNLMRNSYSPLLMKDWDAQALKRGDMLVLIGPSRSFSYSEIKEIRQFVESGGHLILATGWEDLSGSENLWEEFGLQVEKRPLGRVLVKQPEGEVRLYRGWSIKAVDGNPQVLCSPWGYPAIVRMRVGKGSVVAIADTQFLLDRNLEATEEFCPQNVGFLSRLFRQLRQNEKGASGSHLEKVKPGTNAGVRHSSAQKGGR